MNKQIYFSLLICLLSWKCAEDEQVIEDCAGVENGNNICGCTDSNSINYDSTATYDDGSCDSSYTLAIPAFQSQKNTAMCRRPHLAFLGNLSKTIKSVLCDFVRIDVAEFGAGDARWVVVADNVFHDMVPEDFDFWISKETFLQDFLRPELVAAMDQGDFARMISEVERFLYRCVTASNNRDLFLSEEETVAGGASGEAKTHELLF